MNRLAAALTIACSTLAACNLAATPMAPTTTPQPEVTTMPPTAPPEPAPEETAPTGSPDFRYAITQLQLDGNRVVSGTGTLPNENIVDISLGFRPEWIAAVPTTEGSLWAAISAEGAVEAYAITGWSDVTQVALNRESLPTGAPPLLVTQGSDVELITFEDIAPLTHPVPLANGARYAYLTTNGTLKVVGNDIQELNINALPDARIAVDENDRLLILTGPTDQYGHDVLGDAIEARGVTLIETQPDLQMVTTITASDGRVIEGIGPLWVDLTGDGTREIIVTETDTSRGAQIMAYAEDGTLVASGPAIGQGFRWRHQLGVIPLDGSPRLTEVLTPHIGGVFGVYDLEGSDLVLTQQQSGYTSHVIGTPNLDMAAAGDFDGDGVNEWLLPTQERTEIGILGYSTEGISVAWSLPLEGQLVSNLFAMQGPSGFIWVGAGLDDNRLRVWVP